MRPNPNDDLIILGFAHRHEAERVLNELRRLERDYLLDLDDAVVAERLESGRVKLHQTHDLTVPGALQGGFLGLLVGALLLHPLLGTVAGAAAGGLSGALTDVGINDGFMKAFVETLPRGGSALFVLVRKATPDKVLEALEPYEGLVLQTSLNYSDEAKLRAALEADEADETAAA